MSIDDHVMLINDSRTHGYDNVLNVQFEYSMMMYPSMIKLRKLMRSIQFTYESEDDSK